MNRPLSGVFAVGHPRYLRPVLLFLALVAVMQFSDPLEDVGVSAAVLFWVVRLSAVAISLALVEWLMGRFAVQRFNSPAWLKPAVLSMVIAALPMTIVEAILEHTIPQTAAFDDTAFREVSPLLAFVGEYLTVLSIILPLNVLLWVLIDQHRKTRPVVDGQPARPPFLDKAAGIEARDVVAMEAEEHYVKIRTEARSELVYARFSDAVSQMPGDLGIQVHRSWWVADRAVAGARRGARRYRLQLRDGTEVPVSDKFLEATRDRGLLRRRG